MSTELNLIQAIKRRNRQTIAKRAKKRDNSSKNKKRRKKNQLKSVWKKSVPPKPRNIGGKVQRWFTTILECRASCVHIFIWKQWSFVYHSTLWIFLSSLSVSGWIDVGFFLRVAVTKLQISSVGSCHSVHCAALNKPSVWCGICFSEKSRERRCMVRLLQNSKVCNRQLSVQVLRTSGLIYVFYCVFLMTNFSMPLWKKERRKTPVVLLLPLVLCVFFILTLFSLQLFLHHFPCI